MSSCPTNIDLYILNKSGSEIGKTPDEINELFTALSQNKFGGGCETSEQKKEAIMFILGSITNIFNVVQMSKCFLSFYQQSNSVGPNVSSVDFEYLKNEVNSFVNNSVNDPEVQKQIIINVCWQALLYISKRKAIDFLSNRDFIIITPILNKICDYLNAQNNPVLSVSLLITVSIKMFLPFKSLK